MDRKYDDIKYGLSGGSFSLDGEREGAMLNRVICDKTVSVDIGGDFEIPEHMSELKKLIKVDVIPSAPASFISGGEARISGEVEYSAIYQGVDGEIYRAVFPDKFSISVPIEGASAGADKILISANARPENIACRVVGISRINIRSCISVKAVLLCADKWSGYQLPNESHVHGLIKKCSSCLELHGSKDDARLSCSVDTSGGAARYLSTDCNIFVTEASAGDGYVDCRGYAAVRHLMTRAGELYTVSDKIPFSEAVELDGVTAGSLVAVSGACTGVTVETDEFDEESRAKTDISLCLYLTAAALVPRTLEYVKDMYSTECNYSLVFDKKSVPKAVACKNGNVTFGGREELSRLGFENDRIRIIDVWGSALAESVEKEDDAYVMKGKCRFSFLYSAGEDFEPSLGECELPFRYELDGEGEDVIRFDARVSVIEPRARMEGDKLAFDCELAVSLCAVGEGEICSVSSAKPDGGKKEKKDGFIVCYPDKEDSLWSVSKRYGAQIGEVAMKNGMDGLGEADEIGLPDGVKYMIL